MTIDTDDMRKFRSEMERLRGAYIMDIAGACDMYAAALARAEAAEAERDDLRVAQNVLSEALEAARQTLVELSARVAELEATLASDAADENQYLDAYIDAVSRGGETIKKLIARVAELEAQRRFKRGYPDKPGMYIIRRADGTVGAARYYTDGYHWGAFSADITHWAEMPEEPTP